jgi:hypothetical protein
MWDRFKVSVVFTMMNGEPWCRISANVYNELGDYEKLAVGVLTILSEQQQ